jgi:hypothetical protein
MDRNARKLNSSNRLGCNSPYGEAEKRYPFLEFVSTSRRSLVGRAWFFQDVKAGFPQQPGEHFGPTNRIGMITLELPQPADYRVLKYSVR